MLARCKFCGKEIVKEQQLSYYGFKMLFLFVERTGRDCLIEQRTLTCFNLYIFPLIPLFVERTGRDCLIEQRTLTCFNLYIFPLIPLL
jgi:hypothetical protein